MTNKRKERRQEMTTNEKEIDYKTGEGARDNQTNDENR